MTRRDLTRLFIKMFGLLVILNAAISLPSTIYQFFFQMNWWETTGVAHIWTTAVMVGISYFGPIAIYFTVGLIFVFLSGRIVDQAGTAPQDGDLPVKSTDLGNIEVSLVTMIGLYFLGLGLAELCRSAFSHGITYGAANSVTSAPFWELITWSGVPWIAQALLKMMIGGMLVLGRGATVAMVHRTRHWVRKWRAWPNKPE